MNGLGSRTCMKKRNKHQVYSTFYRFYKFKTISQVYIVETQRMPNIWNLELKVREWCLELWENSLMPELFSIIWDGPTEQPLQMHILLFIHICTQGKKKGICSASGTPLFVASLTWQMVVSSATANSCSPKLYMEENNTSWMEISSKILGRNSIVKNKWFLRSFMVDIL